MDLESTKGQDGALVTDELQEYFHLNEVAATIPAVLASHGQQPLSLTRERLVTQEPATSYQSQLTVAQSYALPPAQPTNQPPPSYQSQSTGTQSYQSQPNTQPPPPYQPQLTNQPLNPYPRQVLPTQSTHTYTQQSASKPTHPYTEHLAPQPSKPYTQQSTSHPTHPLTQQSTNQPAYAYTQQSTSQPAQPYPYTQQSTSQQFQPYTQHLASQSSKPYTQQSTSHLTQPYTQQPALQPSQPYRQPVSQPSKPYTLQSTSQPTEPYTQQSTSQPTQPYTQQPASQPCRPYRQQPNSQHSKPYTQQSTSQPTEPYTQQSTSQPIQPYTQQPAPQPSKPYTQQSISQSPQPYTQRLAPTPQNSFSPQATIQGAQQYTSQAQLTNSSTLPCPQPPSTQATHSYSPSITQSYTYSNQRDTTIANPTAQGWLKNDQTPLVSSTIAVRPSCSGPRFPTPNLRFTTSVSQPTRLQALNTSQFSVVSPGGACIKSPRGTPDRLISPTGATPCVPLPGVSSQRAPCPPGNPISSNNQEPVSIPTAAAYHNIPAPFQHRPPVYPGPPKSPSFHPRGGVLRRRGRPQLKFSTIGSVAGLANTVPVVPTSVSEQSVRGSSSDSRLATLPRARTDEVLLSPSTPAFIDTDFNKDLFAEAEQQLAEMQTSNAPLLDLSEIMDLSTSGELPITSPAPTEVAPVPQPQTQISLQSVTQTATHTQSIPHPQRTQLHKHASHSQLQTVQQHIQNIPHTQTAGTLVGQNLIVQQCPVQSVTAQQVLPISLSQTQLSPAHTGISQSHVLRAPFNQKQVIHGPIAQLSPAQLSQAQITQAQLTQAQITHAQFSQAQLSQAQFSQLAHVRPPHNAIRLSQPTSQGALSHSQLTSARALSPAQALSLIRPQQMAAVSLSMLAQTQPAGTITTGTHQQATIINVNPSLAGATLISQPIQMLSSTGYPQMMSMPLQLTGAARPGGAVLMPLQPQAGSMLHQVPQVINTATLTKAFQQRPGAMLTMPAQVPGTKGGKPGVVTTLASAIVPSVPSTPLTLPVTSLGMVSTAQMATSMGNQGPRGPAVRQQQVLNIPRLHLAARPGTQVQTVRSGDPRPMFVLQQPRCSPDKVSMLAQIRPQNLQSLRNPDGKVVGFPPQGHMQVTQMGGTVILTQPTPQHDAQMRIPTCVTSPVRIAKMPSLDDVPLNLDTKSPSASTQQIPSHKAPNVRQQVGGSPQKAATSKTTSTKHKNETSAGVQTEVGPLAKTGPMPIEYDDPDFVWEDFLEETGAVAAPPTSFAHVECSIKSGIRKGMQVEVTRNLPDDAYWVAAIVMTCGPLLSLRYEGYEDSGAKDFWLDVGSLDMHAVGWGASVGRKLQPPEGLKERIEEDWAAFIHKRQEGASFVPAYLLDSSHGVTPIEQMKPGQRLEVQHELSPESVWVVRFLENVGGRLLLRYEGTDRAQHDFWLFYLHHRLHPIGWAKDNNCIYKPPEAILSEHQNYSKWSEILQAALKEAFENNVPSDVFKDQDAVEPHVFQQGWKLEALHPYHRCQIGPATVVRVTTRHFIVQMDSVLPEGDGRAKRAQFCCHAKSADIFPVHWCQNSGICLTPPTGWKKPDFNWEDYLMENNAVAAPESAFNTVWPEHEFSRNQKLEAVNPAKPGQICAATVSRLIGHLMWLHLDSCPNMMANHMVPITSQEIFPVGWCATNGYPLKPPRKSCFRKPGKKVAVVQPDRRTDGPMSADEYRNATYSQIKAGDAGSSWCPKIYFNHKCFSGPFLSKGRIAELPRCVGPGPIPLVLKEVLSMLINVAYKSSRVLRELQLEGTPDANMVSQTLKAKYKGKSYCAVVELCRTTGQIEQYCRQVCLKLECCPNLFSPNFVNGNCPENCHQLTKTKYTCYYGKKKKRKIGRPPGGHSNLENGPIKLGRRRRKRRMNLMVRKKSAAGLEQDASLNGEGGAELDDVFEDDKSWRSTGSSLGQNDLDTDLLLAKKKRKYEHRTLPPSIIKTRGAKLPRYSFERRTHKKIMLSPPPAGRNRAPLQHQHTSAIVMSPKKEPLYADEEIPKLESNPLTWSVMDVVRFIKTTDCAHLARLFRDQAIDGQALLLLTLPAVQDHLDLKLGPAIKLCHHIEQVKIAFYEQFAK